MERTTKPSVVVPSAAAIAAAITATSSPSSARFSSAACTAGAAAAASASFTSLAALASAAFFASGFGMNLNREIRRLNKISITNTVPIPIRVLSPALWRVFPMPYCTSTDRETGVPVESNT